MELIDHGDGECVLGIEMIGERALRHSGALQNIGQTCFTETSVAEMVDGGVDDLLPGCLRPGLQCHVNPPLTTPVR